jgi:hypothetical protein
MVRHTRGPAVVALALALVAGSGREAAALEVVSPSDVKALAGKKAFVEVPCSARVGGKEVHLFVGQELTIVGPGKISAWAKVSTAEGTFELMLENLSKTKPAYDQLATGKLETFIGQVFVAAYDIPEQLAQLWKKKDYKLDDEESSLARSAYEKAFAYHEQLVGRLVNGRTNKAQVLGDEKYRWLWTADQTVQDAYCEGMTYLAEYKKSDFLKKCERTRDVVSARGGLAESARAIMRAKHELKEKYWLKNLKKNAPQAQKDALDKEETAKREKKIVELEESMAKTREKTEADRKALGY